MRQRLILFLGALAVALIFGVGQLRVFNFGASEFKFVADFGFGTMAFFGAVLTITATANLFFSEIENRTILTLLAKPVARGEFVIGKLLAIILIVGIFCAVLTAVIGAVIWSREAALMRDAAGALDPKGPVNYMTLAAVGFVQWLKLVVLAAFTLLIASFAGSQLFAVILGFLVLVICHLQFLAELAAVRGSAGLRVMTKLIAGVFPNFQVFDFSDAFSNGLVVSWQQVGWVSLYAFGYTTAACSLAVFSFRAREL